MSLPALLRLWAKKQFFLGQEPAVAEGTLPLYRDRHGVGPRVTRRANPVAAADSLTAQPLETAGSGSGCRYPRLNPDVLVTYDSDGGWPPDHVRVYEIVHRPCRFLKMTRTARFSPGVLRASSIRLISACRQAIYGDGTAKRKAMEAHRTQITVVDEKTLSTRIRCRRRFRPWRLSACSTVTRRRPCTRKPQEAGLVAGVLTGLDSGHFAGIAGSIYHAWSCTRAIPPYRWACWWRT